MRIVKIHLERARLLRAAASNRATLLLLIVQAVAIIFYYRAQAPASLWLLALPALLLIANFLLALALRGVLRNNPPLLVFHFALIVMVLLAFVGQMSALRGTVELAQNETFDGRLENLRRGPWHRYRLGETRFTNLGFEIRYQPGVKRDKTVNRLALAHPDGTRRRVEIGDHVPLVIGHYRFYTSHNKGYAPIFEWRPAGGAAAVIGSVHLPAFPAHEFSQAREWRPPGSGLAVWTLLRIEDEVLPADREFMFRVPARHHLVLRIDDTRHELRPGDRLVLADGELAYLGLSTWMGYKVDYDWTRPWLLATALIGIFALFAHYLASFAWLRRRRVQGPPDPVGDPGHADSGSAARCD